jgi:hypothetical protein
MIVGNLRVVRSTVLKPAVRGVTEAKKLVTIFPITVGCSWRDAFISIVM